MFNSILIVCTGNICRSPIGERLLRQAFPGKKIDSAGTGALKGMPADPSALKISANHGLYLEGHKAAQFTSSLAREYELILVMEKSHLEQISHIAPESRGKTMLLGHWLEQREIPDPYRKSDEAFESIYQLIDRACQLWTRKLTG